MSTHSAFECLGTTPVASLNLTVEHYRHRATGAEHYHLNCDHDEKAFCVAVRTMPMDSTGVAHILEHTVLCGSERYPVRDPFFMMTRRSLNTFMNAMTSSDWTAYPFASQNDKDFFNLLDVYLDAVFFSRLDPLDFAQEGHRLEFADAADATSGLQYKGVVFNEMKGAMSSPVSQLWQGISAELFPTTTYHFNSGGEPSVITDLSYDQLMDFYKSHYHPSNAVFMTFGDLDVSELHESFESLALKRFEQQHKQWQVQPEKRYAAPRAVQAHYGVEGGEAGDLSGQTHHVMGWLLGDSTDLDAQLEANLISQVLLDNSASPLRRALENTELGSSPSPLCGLEDSNREMSFLCGIEGSEPEHACAFENLVLEVLTQVAEEGVDAEVIEAALHQLELHQREIGGDHMPYGLQLIFSSLPAAVHYGNPTDLINLDPALERLREKVAEPGFIQQRVRQLLLDNRHRVRYTLAPDAGMNEAVAQQEQQQLAAIEAGLSDEARQRIVDEAAALKARQAQQDDESLLPEVGLADVPAAVTYTPVTSVDDAGMPLHEYQAGTNGLVYQQLIADLPALSFEQLTWLPFYTHAWTEVGAGQFDYLQQQQRQTATLGSLSAYATIKSQVNDPNQLRSYLVLTGKALATKTQAFSDMAAETWREVRLDEEQRLIELLRQTKARKEHGITGSGHALAMSLAAAPLNRAAQLLDEVSGLPQAKRLKQRVEAIKQQGGAVIVEALQSLRQALPVQPDEALLVHDVNAAAEHLASVRQHWQQVGSGHDDVQNAQFAANQARYWMVDAQVNYCAWALPTVPLTHPDAAPLSVLAGVLRNNMLHTAIREQGGAYGGGATQDHAHACFKFYSYRDPRCEATFEDFAQSVSWLKQQPADQGLVEQAILGVISSMDRPGSPAGEAKQSFHQDRTGRSQAVRQNYREQVLSVSWNDLVRVAETYIEGQTGSRAVVAPRGTEKVAQALGLVAEDY
ncbi:peptidase M16 [Bacterioplanes sanyensis]|uniref:insulinase family protein n=1 Tax=Bacterioplanes sanyensis TaxID=1249553 RepID=UPI00167330B6|nr:insulinase family protein [Bacterioplanes sanyensis]GGY42029.1 peptidase M16 [Bacterioplanes sanyensis]